MNAAMMWMFALATPLALGCGRATPPASEEAQGGATTARVVVVAAQRNTIRRTVTQPGQIEAFDQARLYAKVPAYVERYLVDIGDRVRGPQAASDGQPAVRGQLMAELSAPELEEDLHKQRALVAQAGAYVEQAQAAVKVAQAGAASAEAQLQEAKAAIGRVEADLARWDSEYKRVVQLVSKSAITPKVAEETKMHLQAALSANAEAEAKIESARSVVEASQAQVEKSMADETAMRARRLVAEADEARSATLLGYLKIEAPFDGTVSQRNADIGFFAASGGGGNEPPLFVVVRTDPVRVFVDLPEMDASLADDGDRATVRVQSLSDEAFAGTVTRTSWALDPATRTLRTEVDVPNPDGRLRPGMYARVTIDLAEHADAIVVPASAVIEQDHRMWCVVVVDGRTRRQDVTTGIRAGNEVEIRSGLTGSEQVVQAGAASLTDGQTVEIAAAAASR
jgi:HlyD family secretion protein